MLVRSWTTDILCVLVAEEGKGESARQNAQKERTRQSRRRQGRERMVRAERPMGVPPGAKRFGGQCDEGDADVVEEKRARHTAEADVADSSKQPDAHQDRPGEEDDGGGAGVLQQSGEKENSCSEGDDGESAAASSKVCEEASVAVELPAARTIEMSPSLLILKELLTRDIDQTIKMQLVEQVISRHVDTVIAAEREVANKTLQVSPLTSSPPLPSSPSSFPGLFRISDCADPARHDVSSRVLALRMFSTQELARRKSRADGEVRRLRERVGKAEKSAAKRLKQRDEAKHECEVKTHECRRAMEELAAERRRCDQISSVTSRLDDEVLEQKKRGDEAESEVVKMGEKLRDQQQQATKLHEQTINAYKTELAKLRSSLEAVHRQASLPLTAIDHTCAKANAIMDEIVAMLAKCRERGESMAMMAKRVPEMEREVSILRSDAGSSLVYQVRALLKNFPPRVSFDAVMPGDVRVHDMHPGIQHFKALVQRGHSGARLQCLHSYMWSGLEVEKLEQRVERMILKIEAQGTRSLPIDVDYSVTQVRKIPSDDPRVALRGEFGLFAGRNIKRGEVLGPYAGSLRTEREYAHKYSFVPELFARDAYSYRFSERASHPWTVLGPQGGQVLAHSTTSDSALLGECWSKDTSVFSDDHLLVDAYTSGNRFVFVNDYRRNPFKSVDEHKEEEQELREPNVSFLEVMYKGWPYVLVVSISDVAQGEELLVDYGMQYWQQQRLREQQLGPLTKHVSDLRHSLHDAESKIATKNSGINSSGDLSGAPKTANAPNVKALSKARATDTSSRPRLIEQVAEAQGGGMDASDACAPISAQGQHVTSSSGHVHRQESVQQPSEKRNAGSCTIKADAAVASKKEDGVSAPVKRMLPTSAQQYPSVCKRGKGLARALPRQRDVSRESSDAGRTLTCAEDRDDDVVIDLSTNMETALAKKDAGVAAMRENSSATVGNETDVAQGSKTPMICRGAFVLTLFDDGAWWPGKITR